MYFLELRIANFYNLNWIEEDIESPDFEGDVNKIKEAPGYFNWTFRDHTKKNGDLVFLFETRIDGNVFINLKVFNI